MLLAPFYRRTVKVALLDTRELRMMGDAGPRPPSLDMLARPDWEDRAGQALAKTLIDDAANWDVIDLEPLADPSRMRAQFVQRLAPAGFTVESAPSAGGAMRIALALAPSETTDHGELHSTYGDDVSDVRKGMSVLRRLSRLEWAERDEQSPLADNEAGTLLEEVALELGKLGRVRLARLDDATGEAVAAALVVDDNDRAVVLAMAVDPQVASKGSRLLFNEAIAARNRGCIALDVVTGAGEYSLPMLPSSKQPALAVRVWGHSAAASVGRTYTSVARRARRARETPSVAAAQARAAWTKIRTAAASVAQYDRYGLYRGQLWTRGIELTPGLELQDLTEADYDKFDDHQKADLLDQVALDEITAKKFWRRGDHMVLARLGIRPAGVAWTARGPVEVPELQRTLRDDEVRRIHSFGVRRRGRARSCGRARDARAHHEGSALDGRLSVVGADRSAQHRLDPRVPESVVHAGVRCDPREDGNRRSRRVSPARPRGARAPRARRLVGLRAQHLVHRLLIVVVIPEQARIRAVPLGFVRLRVVEHEPDVGVLGSSKPLRELLRQRSDPRAKRLATRRSHLDDPLVGRRRDALDHGRFRFHPADSEHGGNRTKCTVVRIDVSLFHAPRHRRDDHAHRGV